MAISSFWIRQRAFATEMSSCKCHCKCHTWSIGLKGWPELKRLNQLKRNTRQQPGTRLRIPVWPWHAWWPISTTPSSRQATRWRVVFASAFRCRDNSQTTEVLQETRCTPKLTFVRGPPEAARATPISLMAALPEA